MTTAERANLEQIAAAIEWPDPISKYILSLQTSLSDEQKLEALIDSLYEDSEELKKKFFPQYADKPTGTIEAYARQQKWPAEQKVLIGAISGVLDIWYGIDTAVSAASFGSAMLSGSAAQIIRRLQEMLPKEGADMKSISFSESRALRVTLELLEKGEGMAYGLIRRPDIRAMRAIVKRNTEKGRGNTEDYEAFLKRYSEAVKRVDEEVSYLRSAAVLWEQDKTGKIFVAKAAEEVRDEPLSRKAELHLPFAIGKSAGAAQASKLYIERYDLLH